MSFAGRLEAIVGIYSEALHDLESLYVKLADDSGSDLTALNELKDRVEAEVLAIPSSTLAVPNKERVIFNDEQLVKRTRELVVENRETFRFLAEN